MFQRCVNQIEVNTFDEQVGGNKIADVATFEYRTVVANALYKVLVDYRQVFCKMVNKTKFSEF